MSLARDLVALESQLQKRGKIDYFLPIERSGLALSAEFSSMLARIPPKSFQDPAAIVRLCLQALHVQQEELQPRLIDAELVATLPPEVPGIARPTDSVMREMLNRAAKEVILLGYEFTDSNLLQLLVQAAARGADVIMICDRGRGSAQRILDAWPHETRRPRILHDRERSGGAIYASMHAKCLLIDQSDLLVTSANFTFHGLHGNIEIGVRLSGPPAAEARKIFSHLVENRIVVEQESLAE